MPCVSTYAQTGNKSVHYLIGCMQTAKDSQIRACKRLPRFQALNNNDQKIKHFSDTDLEAEAQQYYLGKSLHTYKQHC